MTKRKNRVLVIEDSSFMARVLESRLIREGFEVIVSFDGEDGLRQARLQAPDVIILDLVLPKLSGEAVCKELKKDDRLQAVPVIMLTAKSSDTDKVIGRVIGADRYFAKPFDMDLLVREIGALI